MMSPTVKMCIRDSILHHAQDPYTRLLVEKRADVMRRYRQVLAGKEQSYA